MAVVKVIDMTAVFDDGMAAVRGMLVTVVGMGVGIAHRSRGSSFVDLRGCLRSFTSGSEHILDRI